MRAVLPWSATLPVLDPPYFAFPIFIRLLAIVAFHRPPSHLDMKTHRTHWQIVDAVIRELIKEIKISYMNSISPIQITDYRLLRLQIRQINRLGSMPNQSPRAPTGIAKRRRFVCDRFTGILASQQMQLFK